ncbi:MAG: restriction endonuclease subunit S, partial [Peptococcaceae bacterium]|nr:restriction endonuclease subunit S [Peptococcaceae bacterium]
MKVKLGNYIKEYAVKNKNDEDIPVYSVTNDKGFCTGYFSKDVASKNKTTYKIVPQGYFAYNPSRINVGSIDYQKCEDKVIVSPLYVVFSVNEEIDPDFLLSYLKSDVARAYIKAYATGSVRDNLKYDILEEIPIQMYSLETQKKMAAHLISVDELIEKKKYQLKLLDELVKSRFIEMFGDFKSNLQRWPVVSFPEFAEIDGNMTTDYEKYADYPHIG